MYHESSNERVTHETVAWGQEHGDGSIGRSGRSVGMGVLGWYDGDASVGMGELGWHLMEECGNGSTGMGA